MRQPRGKRVAIGVVVLALCLLSGAVWLSWPKLRFWFDFESIGANPQGLSEFRHRRSGIVFVRIPAGEFLIGSSQEEIQLISKDFPSRRASWADSESPQHRVRLSAFLIAKHEVTQEQWEKLGFENPSYFRRRSQGFAELQPSYKKDESILKQLPVETVTWGECKEFCRKHGLMLPTEAQWEYACRAGKSGDFAGTGKLSDMGWQGHGMHPPGLKRPNDFGIHDMHGNVCEWCEDLYDPAFYAKPEATREDPICTSGSGERVWRGGGWNMAEFYFRSAFRGHSPTTGNRVQQSLPGHIGFRPAYYPLP
jgi:formylglycine-generating enzyme required for sulfatase activity